MKAIRSIGDILQFYNSDKTINLYGYGASFPKSAQGDVRPSTSHCFALNGNIFDPEVDGIDGVISVY